MIIKYKVSLFKRPRRIPGIEWTFSKWGIRLSFIVGIWTKGFSHSWFCCDPSFSLGVAVARAPLRRKLSEILLLDMSLCFPTLFVTILCIIVKAFVFQIYLMYHFLTMNAIGIQYLITVCTAYCCPGRVAQWVRVSSRYTKVAGSMSSQNTYKKQPINIQISGTINRCLS